MALPNYPNNPQVNDTFLVGNKTFQWDGEKWKALSNADNSLRTQLADPDSTVSIGGVEAKELKRKYLEFPTVFDFGSSLNLALEQAAFGNVGSVGLKESSFVTDSELSIDTRIDLCGNGSVSTSVADTSIINYLNTASPSVNFGPILVEGITLENQPESLSDNYAALSFFNVNDPKALNLYIDNVETGIRLGYVMGGGESSHAITALNHIKKAKKFGVEHIETNLPLTLGNIIHNDGVRVGSHGFRYTATDTGMNGAVACGNIVADRAGNGVSFQQGVKNVVYTGGLVTNVDLAGVTSNLSVVEAQQNFIQASIVGATTESVNLTNLSNCVADITSRNAGGTAVRVGNGSSDGCHIVKVSSLDDNSAVKITSDANMVQVLADNSTANSAVLVSGNKNIVDVIAKNCADITVYITGNDNVVRVIEETGVTTGLRIDGSRNTVTANVSDTTSINGDGNVLLGQLLGNVFNNGVNNDLTKVSGFSSRGRFSGTTDINGDLIFNHNLKPTIATNASATVSIFGDNSFNARVKSITSSQLVVNVKDELGANVTSTTVSVAWQAEAV